MPVMYVDESGSVSYNDNTNFFVLSGVIVEEDKINDLKRSTYEYKLKHFTGQYVDAEIHAHDIFKAKGDFASLSFSKQQEMSDELYRNISSLDITAVSVVIDKESLRRSIYVSHLFIFTTFISPLRVILRSDLCISLTVL